MPTLPEEFQIPVPGIVTFPVKVGLAERTRLVVPVEPETSLIEETTLARVIVLAKFFDASVVTNLLAVNPEKLIVPLEVIPVNPEATPAAVTSQTLELMVILSPLSPRVTTPLASNVPLAVTFGKFWV